MGAFALVDIDDHGVRDCRACAAAETLENAPGDEPFDGVREEAELAAFCGARNVVSVRILGPA